MCSVSLSKHLLCLTGRFSIFRANVATNPELIAQIEADYLHNWLFGEYEMFSGDDKSTWYWLSSHGYQTLYVPDAMVTTYESVTENPVQRAIANLKRWSGNMLRNSRRAIALGPAYLGFFPWLCCIDQLVSFWTVLIGPTCLVLGLVYGRWELVASYVLWLLATRTIRVTAAWRHGRRFSLWYVPLQVLSEWTGAVVKVWVVFHPVKQTWLNRGNRTVDATGAISFARIRRSVATLYCIAAVLTFVLVVGAFTQLIPFGREFRLIWGSQRPTEMTSFTEAAVGREYFGRRDWKMRTSLSPLKQQSPSLNALEETTP
jgi:glycosyltransferase Alg8